MSNIKISELPEVTSLTPTDVLPSVKGGITSKITVQNLASSLTTVNTAISAINAGTALSATSASYASTAKSASYSLTSVSASYVSSASYAINASTASYVTASNVRGPFGSNSVISSSYALTASYALNGGGGGGATSTLTRFWVENVTQSIQPDETIVVSDNYVMKNCLLILSGSADYYDVGPLNFSKKAELIVGGHILFVDCQIINDGLISVAGGIVLSGSSTITGTGTII